jgi:tRNA 2-thiouridine synthesizing protein A
LSVSVLDVRGLQCPLPVLRANKALRTVDAGAPLTVLATDPAAPQDFESFCRSAGHRLESCDAQDGIYTIVIVKAG